MSAFVMNTTGFNTLGCCLYDLAKSRHHHGYYYPVLGFLFKDWQEGYNASDFEIKHRIEVRLNQLIHANNRAVDTRYDEKNEPDYISLEYKSIREAWSTVQIIKNLQCLRYQMSEGDVPETLIYKKLETLISGLCEHYVDSLGEYDAASWGW